MAIDPFKVISVGTSLLNTFGQYSSLRGAATGQELNAKLAQVQADSVIEQGNQSAIRQQEQANKIIGSQMLAYAKAGVKFSGSPSDVFLETAKNIRRDIIMTRLNAVNRSNQLQFEATQRRIKAGQLKTASIRSVGKGLLNTFSSFVSY